MQVRSEITTREQEQEEEMERLVQAPEPVKEKEKKEPVSLRHCFAKFMGLDSFSVLKSVNIVSLLLNKKSYEKK